MPQYQEKDILNMSYKYPIVLYDGVCHLCHHSVSWIIERDSKKVFKFLPIQWIYSLPKYDSVLLYWQGKIYNKSAATIEVLGILSGKYILLARLLSIVPNFIRNWMYDIIARNRYRWFGLSDSCVILDKTYYEWMEC